MCGIAGAFGGALAPDVTRAQEALRHRGPDGRGTESSQPHNWHLVHTRLAINDLSPNGAQPMWDERGHLAMVFNGEIYNYLELRHRCEARGHVFRSNMDGEVVLHLFEDEGTAAFALLNGIFAIAVIDARGPVLHLARDQLGVKPLFYSAAKDGLAFASELQALPSLGASLGGPSPAGIGSFLAFQWVPAPLTPFENVRALRPGEVLTTTARGTSVSRFAPLLVGGATTRRVSTTELATVFEVACRRQTLADVPLGIMLSGGIDSSLLLSYLAPDVERAYTIAWSNDEHREGIAAEASSADGVAKRVGIPITQLAGGKIALQEALLTGDLIGDPALTLTSHIAAEARRDGIPVLFSGQGGDELFGGYRRHQVARLLETARKAPLTRLAQRVLPHLPQERSVRTEYARRFAQAVAAGDDFSAYMQLCTYTTASQRAAILDCDEGEVADDVVTAEHRAVFDKATGSLLRRGMALDLNVYLPGLGLTYADRAGMAHGVEIRVPWLDLDLVRWSLDIPDDQLCTLRESKLLPRRLLRNRLGEALARQPKSGFGAPVSRIRSETSSSAGTRQGTYTDLAIELLQTHAMRWSQTSLRRPT